MFYSQVKVCGFSAKLVPEPAMLILLLMLKLLHAGLLQQLLMIQPSNTAKVSVQLNGSNYPKNTALEQITSPDSL